MKLYMPKLFLSLSVLLSVLVQSANALPSFTRQTTESCMACHVQNTPKLNNYGREFALSGYTLYDAKEKSQPLIEGSDVPLGLPPILNASAILKARYVKTTNSFETASDDIVAAERGELQVFEGSGIYFAGRIAENAGGIVSITGDPSTEKDVAFGGKVALAYPIFEGYGGLTLYSTQLNGIYSGMENFNTGLNAPLRQFENAYVTNAAQATGIGSGPATGVQLYYGDDNFFATLGAVIPSQNNEGIDAGGSLLPFWRVSYTQPIEKWNFMIGAYGLNGDVKASDESLNGGLITAQAELVNIHKYGYGFDFEARGSILDMMTMTTVNVVMKNVVDVQPGDLLTSENLQKTDNSATSIEFQINPITPLGVKLAYLNDNNEDDTTINREFVKAYDFDAYSFGLSYLVRQNITIGAEYTYSTPKHVQIDNYEDFYLVATISF